MFQKIKAKASEFNNFLSNYKPNQRKLEKKLDEINLFLSEQNKAIVDNQERVNDMYALELIHKLRNTSFYLPITTSSLKPHSLALILNEILINGRKNLIEFGSGVSTVVIARLIQANNLQAHLFSVEENESWLTIIKNTLETENLLQYVTLIHAPLINCSLAIENNLWYSVEELNRLIPPQIKFDLVLVDGPSAWRPDIELSRYPALEYMQSKLHANFSFFLDDANRRGEQKIIDMWQKKYSYSFYMLNSSLSAIHSGECYNITI